MPTLLRRSSSGHSTPRPAIAPGPPGHLLFGHMYLAQRDPLHFFSTLIREYGPVARYRFGYIRAHMVVLPEHVKHVLQDHQKNYTKEVLDYRILRWLLGQGLLTSEGSFWLRQRRLAQPAFHRERIQAYGRLMIEAAEEMLARWDEVAARGEALDVAEEMMALTLQIAGRALFGTTMDEEVAAVGHAFGFLNADLIDRMFTLRMIPPVLPTRRDRRFRTAMRELDATVDRVIAERRRTGEDTGDLISMLLHARDADTGEQMSDAQVRDEVRTLLLTGYETTAVALTWIWYLLAEHPEVAARLRAELASVLGGRAPTVQDVPDLVYTRMVIDEAMRLYPPVWGLTRHVVADDEIGGFFIPKNSVVSVSPYVTHRLPDLWEDPERFDPERFAPERAAGRPRYAYFPFIGGPRQCIGNSFALMEAVLILVTVAQRYRLELVPGHPVVPQPLLTLRARHGMRMTLHRAAA